VSASPSSSATTVELRPVGNQPLEDAIVDNLGSTPAGFALLGHDQDGRSTAISGSADGRSWDRLEPSTPGWPIDALGAGPLGWIAATKDTSRPSTRLGLWFSDDGRTWELLPDQAGIGASSIYGLGSVAPITAGEAGFAMTGLASVSGNSEPAVWTSIDGRTWQEAEALHGMGVDRVIVLPDGYFALASGLATAAFSVDGITWRDIAAGSGSPFGASAGGSIVVPLDAMLVVLRVGASGALELFTGDTTAATSGGAIAWQHRAGADLSFAGAGASTAASSGETAVILGYDLASLAPIAWTSSDGLDWHRAALDPATFGGGVPGQSAAGWSTTTPSFVALGARANTAGEARPEIWRSGDGVAWSEAGGDLLGILPAVPTGPCPTSPPGAVEDLLALAPSLWPACFGSETLQIKGYLAECGCGGTTSGQARPAWLIDPMGFSALYLEPAVVSAETGPGGFGGMIDPAHPVTVPAPGTHVELTGHFDDPAAATCRVFPIPGAIGPVVPMAQTIARCRQAFVVTAIRTLR
jgi:hypothetical protein